MESEPVNRQLVLTRRPRGLIGAEHFEMRRVPVPSCGQGEILVRNLWLAFDPTQRGKLLEPRPFVESVGIGEVMFSRALGQVVESRHPTYRVGQLIVGEFGWQDWAVSSGQNLIPVFEGVPPQAMLSLYGSSSLAAYFGLTRIGRPEPGETVLISGAAGATGSIAGQIARIFGARVLGVAGSPEKCRWLVDVARFDAAINYKDEPIRRRLKELAPEGVDVYFDNVGGPLLSDVLAHIRRHARVVLCGAISTGYQDGSSPPGPANYFNLCLRSSKMEGFRLRDYADQHDNARWELHRWAKAGQLVHREDIQHGLENAPMVLRRLFEGLNEGKQLLQIDDPPLPVRRSMGLSSGPGQHSRSPSS